MLVESPLGLYVVVDVATSELNIDLGVGVSEMLVEISVDEVEIGIRPGKKMSLVFG